MANPSRLTITLAAAAATAVAAAQTPVAAGNLVMNGTLIVAGPTLIQGVNYSNYAQFDVARRVSIASAGADAAVVFTVRGFNRDLAPISENVTGVATPTPVGTLNDFLIVTSVGVSGATAGAITVGTNTIGSTAWVLVNPYASSWALSAAAIQVSGSVTYQIEHTYDDPNAVISLPLEGFVVEQNSAVPPTVWVQSAAVSTPVETQWIDKPIMAHRLTVTAGTGVAAFWSVQAGIKS
jgi:hypothetical protein